MSDTLQKLAAQLADENFPEQTKENLLTQYLVDERERSTWIAQDNFNMRFKHLKAVQEELSE